MMNPPRANAANMPKAGNTTGGQSGNPFSGLPDDSLIAFQQALIDEYRNKHPELNDYELYVAAEVNDFLKKAEESGMFVSPRDAIEFGIRRFQEKFIKANQALKKEASATENLLTTGAIDPVLSSLENNQNLPENQITPNLPQASSSNPTNLNTNASPTGVFPHSANKQGMQEVSRLALNMDLSGNPVSVGGKLSPEDIWNMPREQFLELDRKIRQQHYQ